jgi:hypothetical protein
VGVSKSFQERGCKLENERTCCGQDVEEYLVVRSVRFLGRLSHTIGGS